MVEEDYGTDIGGIVMRKFVAKLREALKPYDYYAIRQEQREEELIELGQEVQRMGFAGLSIIPEFFSNPGEYLGTAIKIANHYGIVFGLGMTHYGCRAFLPRERWQRELNLAVQAGNYGSFFQDIPIEEKKEMENIVAIGNDIKEAVCKCLIYARNAGVL